MTGYPDGSKISTSYVERNNLTMRMGMRRFTRLTNGFSGTRRRSTGNATDNGAATTYVLKVKDVADPGKGADTFSIQTTSGYSTSGTLTGGNVQVE